VSAIERMASVILISKQRLTDGWLTGRETPLYRTSVLPVLDL